MSVVIRDVTLRDGLQLAGKTMSVAEKVDVVRRLLSAGFEGLEIGSVARPDLVPSMANTLEVVGELTPEELARCYVWVATPSGVRRALDAGVVNVQYCLSVSDAHNRANLGRSTEDSLAALPKAVTLAQRAGARIQLCLATAFTCPFEGPVPVSRVLDVANDPRAEGTADIVLCDTLGQASPAEVTQLLETVGRDSPPRRLAFHGHDTWGMGVANTLAAVAGGAVMVDGALGGLGGCPFAPGASGNTSTEDLLFAMRPAWLTPATLHEVVAASTRVLGLVGEDNRSRAVEGVRSGATAFAWAATAVN